jgi:hypothetical protein
MCKLTNSLTKLKYCNDILCTENALKHLFISVFFKNFPGVTPPDLRYIKGGDGKGKKGREGKKDKDRRDPCYRFPL